MKNEYQVTWERFKSWEMKEKFSGNGKKKFAVLLVFGIVYFIIGAVLAFALTDFGMGAVAISCLFFFLSAVAFYLAYFNDIISAKREYRLCVKNYGRRPFPGDKLRWIRTVVFEDNTISVYTGDNAVHNEYTNITDIEEKEDEITILFANGDSTVLYKSAFTEGDWPACKAKIAQKNSGRTVTGLN